MTFFPRSVAALAAAALFPVLVAAQEPQGPPPPQGGRGGMRGMAPARQMANRPQLTDAQREQMRTFDEQQRQTMEATHREIGDLHRQLNEALTAEKLDPGKINGLRTSIVQKETALAQARVDRLSKLSSILTAEQRQSLGGRGLGEILGPGGAGGGRGAMAGRGGAIGRPGGRGGVMVAPRGPQAGRGMIQQRRAPRGGGAGGGFIGGGRGGRRDQLNAPRGAGAGDVARLRAEIRRLEAQLELLRRRIR